MKKTNTKGTENKTLRIRLPLHAGGSDVVEIGLNGSMTLLRRGEVVELPEELVHILKNAGMAPEIL